MKSQIKIGICGFPHQGDDIPPWVRQVATYPEAREVWAVYHQNEESIDFALKEARDTDILVLSPDYLLPREFIMPKGAKLIRERNPVASLARILV